MFNNRFRKYCLYAQMSSFIFETIIEFSAAIRNVNAQLVLMNRGLTSYIYNANLNATVGPADLFVPLRNKSSSSSLYSISNTNKNTTPSYSIGSTCVLEHIKKLGKIEKA